MALPSVVFLRDELYERLEKMGLKETALDMLNSATSDEHRVAICLYFMGTCDLNPPEEIRPPNVWTKSEEKAMDLRKAGNMKYSAKEYAEAVLLYTRSIATAPMNSSEEDQQRSCLSLAFANRSAALMYLGKYRECIRDVDYALDLGYPLKWRSKLYLRRGKCEKLLGSANAAKENYKMALTYLMFGSDEKIAKEINNCLKDVSDIATQLAGTSLDDSKEESRLPLLKNGSSTKMLSASKCVEIAYLTSVGRHLIATEPIDPGDVLVIDKAHSSVLFEDYCYTHCSHCLKRSLVLIPCTNCTKVMFCSEDCRNKGWRNYHEIECPILPYLHQMRLGRNSLLAMKTVLKLFLTQDYLEVQRKILKEEKLEESLRGLNDEGTYSSLNYNAMFWLVTNIEQKSLKELFENLVLASYLVQILEAYTPFFSLVQIRKLVDSGIQGIGSIFGGLLLRHLHNFPCNAHSVMEIMKSGESSPEKCVEIGAAAYATLSLINHSCDPNVGCFFHNGDTGVLRAVKSIAPGEQLFDNYGYHYSMMDKNARQVALQCYYQFRCNCQACCEEWPVFAHQPSDTPIFICQECKTALNSPGKCSRCGAKDNRKEIQTYLHHSGEEIEKIIFKLWKGRNISEGEIAMLIKHLKVLELNFKLPWQQYCRCQEALKHYFSKMGNYFSAL